MEIRRLSQIGEQELRELGEVLIDCVEGGASVNFMFPMTRAKADAYWRGAAESLARKERLVLAAYDGEGKIAGTVQVLFAPQENQPHRGELSKMLVHRRARRSGLGAALLIEAEKHALQEGKTLLVLDTASDDAERLYARQGWQLVGTVPDYALWPHGPMVATKIFYKSLSTSRPKELP